MDDSPESPIQRASKYASIDEIRGKIPKPESVNERIASASERTARAAERSARMATGELIYDLPEDKEAQRKLVIGLVEQIETTDLPIGPLPNIYTLAERQTMNAITRLLDLENCSPEVKREATARLKLQHCFAIAASIPGQTEQATGFLLSVFQHPESKRWALEGEDFNLFLKEGIKGLSISKAFNLLEKASTVGIEVNGELVVLTDDRISLEDRRRAREKIIQELGGGKRAEKSLQLADRIASATLEISVWNRKLIGNDPLAEAIYLQDYRTKRLGAARDRGPDVTIDRIKGFGTSYFRSAQTLREIKIEEISQEEEKQKKGTYLFLPEKRDHLAYLAVTETRAGERIRKVLRRNRGELPGFDKNKPVKDQADKIERLNIENLDYKSLKSGDYAAWLSVVVPRILVFKSFLLKTDWKPEDFSSEKIEGYIAPSNVADPEEMQGLRAEFLIGAFWSVFSRGEAAQLGWDSIALGVVVKNLTTEIKTGEGEVLPAFVIPEEWNWVKDTVLRKYYGLDISHMAAIAIVERRFRRKYG